MQFVKLYPCNAHELINRVDCKSMPTMKHWLPVSGTPKLYEPASLASVLHCLANTPQRTSWHALRCTGLQAAMDAVTWHRPCWCTPSCWFTSRAGNASGIMRQAASQHACRLAPAAAKRFHHACRAPQLQTGTEHGLCATDYQINQCHCMMQVQCLP